MPASGRAVTRVTATTGCGRRWCRRRGRPATAGTLAPPAPVPIFGTGTPRAPTPPGQDCTRIPGHRQRCRWREHAPLLTLYNGVYSIKDMAPNARSSLTAIRRSLDAGRYRLTPHFRQRLAERWLLWADVLAVFDAPLSVRHDGEDQFGRPKWIVGGKAADGLAMEIVCVLDHDEHGRLTVFITAYFER